MTESAVEALEDLLARPGWRLFWDHVKSEWGPTGHQFQAQMDQALDLTDNDAAASQARQIRSAQKVIAGLMQWPQEEINRVKRQTETKEPSLTRRGSL